LNNYIEKTFNDLAPDNKGYIYIRTEEIFIPIYKVILSITKRKQTKLNLVEEMVLKIANYGVTDLDEIAGILGLNRDILDITIGDLFIKSLAYPSSNKCYIMADGHNVLKDLNATKKETDTIRNIYVNAINKDIFAEKSNKVVQQCVSDSTVRHTFDGKNIEFYRDRVGIIKEIFNRENEVFLQNGNQVPDELVSIDEVDDICICFLKIPTHIYVSETGTDIDLISTDKKSSYLIESIKGEILEQIRKHRLLKKTFTRFAAKEVAIPEGKFDYMDELKTLIKKYVIDKQNQDCYLDLIKNKIYSNRVLMDNEFEKLYELCLQNSKKIDFYLDNLDYWSKDSSFITMLTMIPVKTNYKIFYDNVVKMNLAEKRIKLAIPQISKDAINQYSHVNWFKLVIDDRLEITGCPQNYKAVDFNTRIIKIKYYLQIKS